LTQNSDGKVFLIKTSDRSLLNRFNMSDYRRKTVAMKANFNSADPFPASTHIDTLENIVKILKESGSSEITLAERSGMGKTREVLEQNGVFDLSEKLGFKVVVLDEEDREAWVKIDKNDTHWLRGFYISKIFLDADKVVQICCLKTHRFGGHFTMSLKNSIGLVARRIPKGFYNYMWELHDSPHQRLIIAEVNKFYKTDLIIMDAIKAFVKGGPESGELIEPNLILASKDRIAIDAVGVAILKYYGSTKEIMNKRIFELDQIRRASELDMGVKSASDIILIPLNDDSTDIAREIDSILESQG
jgi:uncharacterized protein (DUF362 family)